MYLLEPLESLEDSLLVFNNKQICQKEIKSIITNKFEDQEKFIKYNPLSFAKKLEAHPLIKDVFVRTKIFPKKEFSILVNEEKPWAFFRNKIYNENFKVIKNFNLETVEEDFDSVFELHSAILNNENDIIHIKTNLELKAKQLKVLKQISDLVNQRLEMIELKNIFEINIIDGEMTLVTEEIKLIIGKYKKGFKKKLKKLDHMLVNIKEKISELEYIDLSMDTNEAILGKRL